MISLSRTCCSCLRASSDIRHSFHATRIHPGLPRKPGFLTSLQTHATQTTLPPSESITSPSPGPQAPLQLESEPTTSPGQNDDTNFEQHWSVKHWRNREWNVSPDDTITDLASRALDNVRQAEVLQDATTAAFWAYHTSKWMYFLSQGAASILLNSAVQGDLQRGQVGFVYGAMDRSAITSYLKNTTREVFATFAADLADIKEGSYKLPWDMTTPGHRQSNPLYIARQASLYFQEALAVLGKTRNPEENLGALPFSKSTLYPDYYQNNFHFQSDGWFSSRSARVYDVATETLFLGRQDAMQRVVMLPIARRFGTAQGGAGLKMLEVGAGTGRLATFVRDNYPAAHLTVLDLSPFYLEQARKAMAYWERCTSSNARTSGSVEFVQCAAERLPQEGGSLDVVYSVYMFHEMPKAARQAALREFARVLKPGGLLVIADSTQRGDRPALEGRAGRFTRMNEPHFADYREFDFGQEFRDAGLKPDFKAMRSVTKAVSAVKEA